MKKANIKTKLLTVLLVACMVLSFVPISVLSVTPATETADFTAADSGAAALTLLNETKTSTIDSTWDSSTKTLTLRGINFTTTAATAVKLPADTTVILEDGSTNSIHSGDITINVSGENKNQAFINALDAAGNLTIQGGTAGTGTLEVTAGKVKNEGNAWTYSSGISVYGDFNVKGGYVTTRGGYVEGQDSCFSIGVNMDNNIKNKELLITGGTLSVFGGESYEIQEDGSKRAVFSKGVYIYRGNVIVSGDSKLRAESVEKMSDAGLLSNGLYISEGDLTVADTAEVAASGGYGVEVSGGNIELSGGKLIAASTQAPDAYGNLNYAISVKTNNQTNNGGNITVSGGTLETNNGKIYMSTFGAAENQGAFSVTGGTIVNRGQLDGAKKVNISNGSVQTWSVDADALTLSGGTLTIREPVRKSPYDDSLLLVRPAVKVSTLDVSGGILDAAWVWGEITPSVLPVDDYYGYATSLVQMPRDFYTATFTGGTTLLDTGKAGNTALLIKGKLTLGDGMVETGANANHCQTGSSPVKFIAESESDVITTVDVENAKFDYQPGDAPQATAKRAGVTQHKYDILYECWQKREKGADDTLTTVGYWYSDESYYSNSDSRFNTFEKGGRYKYSVKLKAKDGYTFESNLVNEKDVTLNGSSLPFGTFVNVMDEGKTCLITYGTEMRPGQAVKEIRLDGAVINFNAGDKPHFSGVVDSYIDIDHQRWDADDDSGYGITSSDFWNERYNGKLIKEFEAGKSYTYGIYFKISNLGMEEGYHFDKNTKLYINGQEIALTSDQISLDDGGETIWFYNVLTMTPQPSETIPDKAEPDDSKSPQTGDNSNLILWIALFFISGGFLVGITVFNKKKELLEK